jgi:hypothetical protein
MQRQTVSACGLALLLVVSTVALTVPAAATAGAQPSTASATTVDATTDSAYNQTAFLAAADAGDGATVVGGATAGTILGGSDTRVANATVMRIDADGQTDWTKTFEGPNATRVVDVTVGPDGSVYFLHTDRPVTPQDSFQSGTLQLGRLTADGDLVWRTTLDGSASYASGARLVTTDDGAAVAYPVPESESVRFAEFASSDTVWERTYDVGASPSSLERTGDGFLVAGTAGFGEPWVLRTTESGRPTLNETLPGIDADRVVGAVPADDGGVVLAGQQRPGFGAGGMSTWAAGIDSEGHTTWTRVYGVGSGAQFQQLVPVDDGFALVGQTGVLSSDDAGMRLLGIGTDGAQLFDETVETSGYPTAMARTDEDLTVASVQSPLRDRISSSLESVAIPGSDVSADASIEADVGITSNETVYRGQNLRVSDRGGTYELVRLPDEYDEFEPHVVRRIAVDDEAVVESATLPRGEYVVQTTDGQAVELDDGEVTGQADREEAAFTLSMQDFFGLETSQTFLNVAAGEEVVTLTAESDRTDYDAYVSAERSTGESATAAELRDALGDVPGFVGIETVDGEPTARITMGDSASINASVDGLDAGMYEFQFSGVDTRDGGAVATGRVVVGKSLDRQLGVELANETLTVPVGQRTSTNVTLTNVTDGVSAMSMSLNRTGEPAVRVRADISVNASRASSSVSLSDRESEASAEAFNGNTGNGTVLVGTVGARAGGFTIDENTTGTNTATFRIDWVVDEDGNPYALPDERTITIEVVPGNGTDGGTPEEGTAGTGSGSTSGSTSSSGGE